MTAQDQRLNPFVRTALRQAGYSLRIEALRAFLENIEANVTAYLAHASDEPSTRKAHDALKRIWKLLNDPDPPIGMLRTRVQSLPTPAKRWLLQRGAALWKHLVGGEFSGRIFEAWIQSVDATELVRVLKSLVSEGGMMLDGRQDRQLKRGFEPMIMGVIRGTGEGLGQGGRPSPSARDELVMHLAIDWLQATGEPPLRGRSDKEGFAGLVYMIFDLLEIKSIRKSNSADENNGAEQALRRYWASVANDGYAPKRKKSPD